MGVIRRLSGLLEVKANKALDKAENPSDVLDFNYQKQLESLQRLKAGLLEIASSRKNIEYQASQLKQSAAKLEDQARQALSINREDLAREALSRRSIISDQLQELQSQHEQLILQENKVISASERVQAKIESFKLKKEMLKATYTAAQAQTKIGEIFSGLSKDLGDTGLAMQRAEDKVSQMQARAFALDELMLSGALDSSYDDIQAQLNQGHTTATVQNEIARIKAELSAITTTPQLIQEVSSPKSKTSYIHKLLH